MRTQSRYKVDRDKLISKLRRAYPNMFLRTTEEFNGTKGGIWTSGEESPTDRNGDELFDYYSEDYDNRTFGVINHFDNFLNRNGWFCEWYDAGTMMIYPID